MLRSLFSGISGMKNHQVRLDVIGNNIANVNTMGYKAKRVVFKDVFSQTLRSGNTGQNPLQVGMGVSLGSIDAIHTTGNPESTGVTTDLALEGNGFFMLMDGEGSISFTRAGNFGFNHEGYLVSMTNGSKVVGMSDFAVTDGMVRNFADAAAVAAAFPAGSPLLLNVGGEQVSIDLSAVTTMDEVVSSIESASPFLEAISVNRGAAGYDLLLQTDQGKTLQTTAAGFTNLGSFKYFEVEAGNALPAALAADESFTLQIGNDVPVTVNLSIGDNRDAVLWKINDAFDGKLVADVNNGKLVLRSTEDGVPIMLVDDTTGFLSNAEQDVDFTSPVQATGQLVPIRIDPDKLTSIKTVSIGNSGSIVFDATEEMKFYDINNQETLKEMNVATVIAPNPSGLDLLGENLYVPTLAGVGSRDLNGNSRVDVLRKHSLLQNWALGKTQDELSANTGICIPGSGGSGIIRSGFLEMSNVDLAQEFANMIVTQRGFQANSRIITTSDEILQELVNLKR